MIAGPGVRAVLAWIVLAGWVAGCGGSDGSEMSDPVFGEVLSEPSVRIGAVSGTEADQLFRVQDATILSDDRIVIVNGGSQELRYFDSDGTHLRSVGGRGGGPGEFMDPRQVHSTAGDTVLVWDADRYALSWFAPEGDFVRSRVAARGSWNDAFGPEWVTVVDGPLPDGSLLVRARTAARTAAVGWDRPMHRLAITDPEDLDQLDTLGTYPALEHYNVGTASQPLMRSVPWFARTTHIVAGGDPMRIYIGAMDAASGTEVRVFRPDGSLDQIIRHEVPLRSVTPDEIEHARQAERRMLERFPVQQSEAAIAEQLRSLPVPETAPPHGELHVGRDGRLWVQEWNVQASEARRHRVFSADGELLGTVRIPEGVRILELGADYLLGLWRDADNVEFVQVHEVRTGLDR